jgi:putative ABC transport system permease protein
VIAEVAIAMVLLVGAGLLLKSFTRLQRVDAGFNPNNILTFNLQLPASSYRDWRQVSELYSALIARLKVVPGVQSADAAGFLPLEGGWPTKFAIQGRPPVQARSLSRSTGPSAKAISKPWGFRCSAGGPSMSATRPMRRRGGRQ